MDQVNKYFKPGFSFNYSVDAVHRYITPELFLSGGLVQGDNRRHDIMQGKHRGSDYASLNIFIVWRYEEFVSVSEPGNYHGTLASTYRPLDALWKWSNAEDIATKSDVLISSVLFAGALTPASKGNPVSLAHECGHWLGLRHTDSEDCDKDNDGIDDTPAHTLEHREWTGCPKGTIVTCPNISPEPDLINNVMTSRMM